MKNKFLLFIFFVSCSFCMAQNFVDMGQNAEIKELKDKAERGDATAMAELGDIYYLGRGTQQDFAKALEWWSKATDLGISSAICNMGILYLIGQGVQQDNAKALELFTKSANMGNAQAMHNLGLLYYQGKGVQQDYKKTFELFTEVAKEGFGLAKGWLSEMYYNGYYVTKDYDKAFNLSKEGSEDKSQPSGTAMCILSAYRYGIGTSIDNKRYWLKKSSGYNDEKAIHVLGGRVIQYGYP